MQQSLRSSDGTDPIFNKVFSNAITAIMVMKAGSEQVDSAYHEAWILKRIGMIRTALHNSGIQISKDLCNQQSQTQAMLLLEIITRASGE